MSIVGLSRPIFPVGRLLVLGPQAQTAKGHDPGQEDDNPGAVDPT